MDLLLLFVVGLLTATLSAILGMGGGILLFAYLGQFYAPQILIPLHGLVQLVSNSTRIYVFRQYVNSKIWLAFAIGAAMGAAAGSQVVVKLPQSWYMLILGLFILAVTWIPIPQFVPRPRGKFLGLGVVTSFLSLFVGTIGPLLAPFFLKERLNRHQIIATKASCQATVHLLKIFVFYFLGFSLSQYVVEIAVLIVSVFVGTWLGKYLLGRVPENIFRLLFKAAITILSLRLVYKGVQNWLAQ